MTTELKPFLTEIADAIRNKKGTSENINAQDFATEIESIETGGGEDLWKILINNRGVQWDYIFAYNRTIVNATDWFAGVTTQPTSLKNAFYYCNALVQMPYIDTSKCTDFMNVCYGCTALTTFPNWDFSSATTLQYAFGETGLTTVPDIDCTNITNMNSAFYNSQNLLQLKLINTQNVTNISSCTAQCYKIKLIDIDTLDGITSQYNSWGWKKNYSLQRAIIRRMTKIPQYYRFALDGFTDTTGSYWMQDKYNMTYNPEWRVGEVYVPDDYVDQMKTATGWSDWAYVFKPLSTMPESLEPTIPYITEITRLSTSYSSWEMKKINDIKYYYNSSYQPLCKFTFTVPENATDNTLTFEAEVGGTETQGPYSVCFTKVDAEASGYIDKGNMQYYAEFPAAGTYTITYTDLTPGEHFIYIGANQRITNSNGNYFKFRRVGGFH